MRVALRIARVVPIDRYQEHVDVRFSYTDRLLLDAADSGHRSVELDLTCRGDLVAVIDVASLFFQQLEREGQAGRRPAHPAEVELDRERQLNVQGLDRQDADDRALWILGVGDRSDRERELLAAAPDHDLHRVPRLEASGHPGEIDACAYRVPVRRDDDVARFHQTSGM